LRETAQLAELSMKRDACSMPGLDPKRQPGIPDMEASRMMTFIVFITSFSFRILAAPVYLPAIMFLIVRHSPFSGPDARQTLSPFGTNIQRRMYSRSPKPQKKKSKVKRNRQHQEGMEVCSPSPPQTPLIHLSFRDFVNRCNQFLGHMSQPPVGSLEFIFIDNA